MKRLSGTLLVVAAGLAIGLGHGTRSQADEKLHKVAICHGTASAKNPYVLIIVDESAKNGHFDGTAPGHGKNNAPDFMLMGGKILTEAEIASLRQQGDGACSCGGMGS